MEPVSFFGFLAACAVVKSVSSLLDTGVSVAEDKKRIDEQAKRLKPWKEARATDPMPRVVTPSIEEDWEALEDDKLDPVEHMDAYRGYRAQRISDLEGRKMAAECDRCHVCGGIDPQSKAAQHRIKQRLGLNGVADEAVKAWVKERR